MIAKRILLSIVLLTLLNVCFCQQASYQQQQLVPVTASFKVAKKTKGVAYRLQVLQGKDSLMIIGFGLTKLPSPLKSLRISAGKEKLKRKAIEEQVSKSLDSVFTSLRDSSRHLSYKLLSPQEYNKQKNRFIQGSKASPFFSSQWIVIAKQASSQQADPSSFVTRGFFKSQHLYITDLLPASAAWELPALDPWNCGPAKTRFFKLRRLEGFGINKLRSTPYDGVSRINIRSNFDVYFPHNEVTPDPVTFQKVTDYLEQNNLVILNAILEGGCSLEGSAQRNHYLQVQRANVLQKALHRFSDELIKKDTVMYTDFVIQFREMIKKTPEKYLDTLSDESLLKLVNEDAELRKTLEPILAGQRKASLNLVVTKRLTKHEQVEKLTAALIKASAELTGSTQAETQAEQRIMGMIETLFDHFSHGVITEEELHEIINGNHNPDYVNMLAGYYVLKQIDPLFSNHEKLLNYWNSFKVQEWLNAARESLIMLFDLDKTQRAKYMRMLVDFQSYNYQLVEAGVLDSNSLCEIAYPERPEFMSLILNQYAYLYVASAEGGNSTDCIPSQTTIAIPSDSLFNTDNFLKDIKQKFPETKTYSLIGNKTIIQKAFDQSQKGPYYYLLKQYYLRHNKSVLSNVSYSDNSSENVSLNVFNLWHLIGINVERWHPFENFFYDKDVQLDEMHRLIGMLKKADGSMCKPQLNSLYLTYSLKMLYYLQNFAEPGNPNHTRYAEDCLSFILNYYKPRVKVVSPALSMHILKQLNAFNWLPGSKTGARYGYDLLNVIAASRLLNSEELRLYAHYQKLFNPQLKRIPPAYDKEMLRKLSEEPY
jgi:hypothetical protein